MHLEARRRGELLAGAEYFLCQGRGGNHAVRDEQRPASAVQMACRRAKEARAEFLIGGDRRERRDEPRAATLICESGFRHRQTCAADTRFGVELKRQISRTDCVFNRTWGYDRNGVWVANGCRAEFLIHLR